VKLTIYGSSQCAACKTFLKMAQGQGIAPVYKLIDMQPQARAEYEALAFSGNQLPAVVATNDGVSLSSTGLQACMSLLKAVKEPK
jgi:arsenate reductase-like glutaredoxin family protein